MVEPSEMKLAWQALEQRLQQQTDLSRQLFSEDRSRRARSALRPLLWSQWIQLGCAFALAPLCVRFWTEHLHQPLALASGLALQLWLTGLIISATMQLLLILRINYALPVVQLQRTLGWLRHWRIRWVPWLGLSFWLLWAVMFEVLAQAITGHDMPTSWLLGNAIVGIAGLLASAVGFRWLRSSSIRHWAERIDRGHAGRSVSRAQAMLDELAEFNRDEARR